VSLETAHHRSYSTFLGPAASSSGGSGANGIASDADGNAYVTGNAGPDFPTVNPFQPSAGGLGDAFVAKLAPDGSRLVYSTYLGGSSSDIGTGIDVDAEGSAYVVGHTSSTDFPTRYAVQPVSGGGFDLFVAKLSPSGDALVWSTYLGGSNAEFVFRKGIAVPVRGVVYIAGQTASSNFPTANAQQPAFGGSSDAFVAKIDETVTVAIDIRPGESPNSINPNSQGKISVAVLSSASFAAPDAVDRASVTFGRTGDERSLESCDAGVVDVDGDGLPDLVCRFSTPVTAFRPGDTEGILKGRTLDGLPIVGRDSVTVVPAQGSVATSGGSSSTR